MATFYFNRHSNEDINSQWIRHIQNSAYINDIGSIVTLNRKELEYTINNGTSEQINAINRVYGKLEDGFAVVTGYLSNIDFNISELRGEINAMSAMLDWRLSQLIEEQKLTNQLLGHIAQLLRIPDNQKQRVYYIEQGLKYLKNAILEGANSAFYDDALESFKESEKIEKKDYITLNRIGHIYLYSLRHFDAKLASEYFLKSAREAHAEAMVGGTSTANNFTPTGLITETKQDLHYPKNRSEIDQALNKRIIEIYKSNGIQSAINLYREKKFGNEDNRFFDARDYVYKIIITNESTRTPIPIKNIKPVTEQVSLKYNSFMISAAEAYLFASRAFYLQQNLSEAIVYARKSYNLIPEFLEAGFELSKYLSANNQNEEATEVLETVITHDRFFSVKAILDNDIIANNSIMEMLDKIKKAATFKAQSSLEECKKYFIANSKATDIINEIEKLIQKDNYLSCMNAVDLLNDEYQLPINIYQKGFDNIVRFNVKPALHIIDFLIQEKKFAGTIDKVKADAKKTLVLDTIATYAVRSVVLGIIIGGIIGLISKEFSFFGGIGLGILIIGGVGTIIGIIAAQSKEPKIN